MLLRLWVKLWHLFHSILEVKVLEVMYVIWYGELLYTCNEIISEFERFMYFMDEIVIRKKIMNGFKFKV